MKYSKRFVLKFDKCGIQCECMQCLKVNAEVQCLYNDDVKYIFTEM